MLTPCSTETQCVVLGGVGRYLGLQHQLLEWCGEQLRLAELSEGLVAPPGAQVETHAGRRAARSPCGRWSGWKVSDLGSWRERRASGNVPALVRGRASVSYLCAAWRWPC